MHVKIDRYAILHGNPSDMNFCPIALAVMAVKNKDVIDVEVGTHEITLTLSNLSQQVAALPYRGQKFVESFDALAIQIWDDVDYDMHDRIERNSRLVHFKEFELDLEFHTYEPYESDDNDS
jgi:hypothetical protein